MAELSAPLVLIQDGMAVIPMIGIVDSYRVSYMVDHLVPKIAERQLRYLIADYSGVLNLNEDIVHSLSSIWSALNLMGVDVVLSGIHPELAITVIQIGIDMSDIETFAHVKQALEWIDFRKA